MSQKQVPGKVRTVCPLHAGQFELFLETESRVPKEMLEMSELCKSDREKRKNLRKYQKYARFVSEIVPRVSPIWNLCA